jgi:hypothetical protein
MHHASTAPPHVARSAGSLAKRTGPRGGAALTPPVIASSGPGGFVVGDTERACELLTPQPYERRSLRADTSFGLLIA